MKATDDGRMRLRDLDPTFFLLVNDGPGNGSSMKHLPTADGASGILFDSPDGNGSRIPIYFANPIGTVPVHGENGWQRQGTTVDDLTLTPSIWINKSRNPPGWHGFITAGAVTNA